MYFYRLPFPESDTHLPIHLPVPAEFRTCRDRARHGNQGCLPGGFAVPVPEKERVQGSVQAAAGKNRGNDMGDLFENMKKTDIQAERQNMYAARQETDDTKRELEEINKCRLHNTDGTSPTGLIPAPKLPSSRHRLDADQSSRFWYNRPCGPHTWELLHQKASLPG